MKTPSRFDFLSGHRKNAFVPSPLPFDTQAKRGIYSPHLEVRPLTAIASGVANGTIEVKGFQCEGLVRSRLFRQARFCVAPARRLHSVGDAGMVAFPVQNGRLQFSCLRADGVGSLLAAGNRDFPSRPDLPVLELDHGSQLRKSVRFFRHSII